MGQNTQCRKNIVFLCSLHLHFYTPMFIVALLTIQNIWNKNQVQRRHDWIKGYGTYIQWNTTHHYKIDEVMCFCYYMSEKVYI